MKKAQVLTVKHFGMALGLDGARLYAAAVAKQTDSIQAIFQRDHGYTVTRWESVEQVGDATLIAWHSPSTGYRVFTA